MPEACDGLLTCSFIDSIALTSVDANYMKCFSPDNKNILGTDFTPYIPKDDHDIIDQKLRNAGGENRSSFMVDQTCWSR